MGAASWNPSLGEGKGPVWATWKRLEGQVEQSPPGEDDDLHVPELGGGVGAPAQVHQLLVQKQEQEQEQEQVQEEEEEEQSCRRRST